jgi:hypothetical protein
MNPYRYMTKAQYDFWGALIDEGEFDLDVPKQSRKKLYAEREKEYRGGRVDAGITSKNSKKRVNPVYRNMDK